MAGSSNTDSRKTPRPSADVAQVFASYPAPVRKRLQQLRRLIFATAARTDGVGEIEETLRWGQPSYLTSATGSGTTIRIAWQSSRPEQYGMFVHCQTTLMGTFRALYPDGFDFDGNRAIWFSPQQELPEEALAHLIELALTYHLDKKPAKRRRQSA